MQFLLTPKRFLFSKNLGNVRHTIKIIFSFFSSLWQKYHNLIRFQFVLEINFNFLPVLLVVMFDLVIFVRVDSLYFVRFGNSEFRFQASLFPVYSPKTALVLAHQSLWVEGISKFYRLYKQFPVYIFIFTGSYDVVHTCNCRLLSNMKSTFQRIFVLFLFTESIWINSITMVNGVLLVVFCSSSMLFPIVGQNWMIS